MKYILFFFILSSCSSMDRESCLSTNWYARGVEDGKKNGEDKFETYKRECAREQVSIINRSQEYKKGMIQGLRSYCTFQNGFNEGLDGQGGTVLCDNINPAFARGYEEGFREFRVTQRRKRDEDERERKFRTEQDSFRQRILSNSDRKECTVDHDCQREGVCRLNRCEHDNKYCTYNYECKIQGWCREVSEYAQDRRLTMKVCDY